MALLAAALATACYKTSEQPDLAGQDIRLTVLHTSDIHSRLLPYHALPGLIDRGLGLCAELQPLGGVARMKYLLDRERARADRVIHLDSGDCFQGAPIFNEFHGEVEVRSMAALGPDAVVVGNHEFDLGAKNLAKQYRNFGLGLYPLLAANYIWSAPGDPNGHDLGALIKPYVILNMRGLKVAVIGMGNTSSMTSIVHGGNSSGITPMEPVEVLRTWVKQLHDQADLIFVVSHMGLTARAELNLAEDTEVISGYERIVPPDGVPPCEYRDAADCWQKLGDEPDGQIRVWVPGVRGVDAIFGGHLHIVLNPPKILVDPAGRSVPLVHSGAFAKFFGRADLIVRMPKPGDNAPWGPEIISHAYSLFPVTGRIPKPREKQTTAVECPVDDNGNGLPTSEVEEGADIVGLANPCDPIFAAEEQLELCKEADACRLKQDACTDPCHTARTRCRSVPAPVDGRMLEMLDPYVQQLYQNVHLNRPFAYATERIRRFGLSGEDSPLGNLVADSMRLRNRVEAQFAMTNSLGIRTNMEEGIVTIEQMFNIFPFENTLTTIFLSGVEVQELFDYVTERSSERGCQAQAQVSGVSYVMNCAQSLRNLEAPACEVSADCEGTAFASTGADKPVRCVVGRCFKSPADEIRVQGQALIETESYKVAVNDYIGRGGSGFEVLRRNTTKVDTGLSLRDALIDYMRAAPNEGGPGRVCGSPFMVDPIAAPVKPLVTFDKTADPDASCDRKPGGCTEASGHFFDCVETDEEVRFYCIPYDFRDPDQDNAEDDCAQIAKVAPLFESLTMPEAGEHHGCATPLSRDCKGQLHCCERPLSGGGKVAEFFCMEPRCIDPPVTGRIKRIVQ